jgi:SPP1 family predicted phage head-tail adaptor
MALASGRLRHRLSLQREVETRDANGNRTKSWQEIAKVWAAVEPMSGRELIAAASVASKIAVRIIIRYRRDAVPTLRFVHLHRGLIYDILAPIPDKESGIEYLTLACSQGANAG